MSRCECKPEVERARGLLRSILPEGQWAQFSETGILEVPGSLGISHLRSRCYMRRRFANSTAFCKRLHAAFGSGARL
jgi:hypothetical protein